MKIVIVGGGFGGVKAALELSKQKHTQVTLVSDRDHFLFYPALYATATGRSRRQSILSLQKMFRHTSVRLVIDPVSSLDAQRRILVTKNHQLTYDNIIFALGVVTSYFGIEGLDKHTYSIKSSPEIHRFKRHLHAELTDDKKLDKNYVVIGAGATGVELSASLVQYLRRIAKNHDVTSKDVRVSLIEAAPRVLPRMSENASKAVKKQLRRHGVVVKTGKFVQEADEDSVTVSNKEIDTKTVVWTSGVTNHPFFADHPDTFQLAKNGRVVVDEHMRAYNRVYVIGDNASTPYSGLAQTAIHDAVYINALFKAKSAQRSLPLYKPKKQPVVIPVGENWAVMEYGRFRIHGFVASIVRRAADFIGYLDYVPFVTAAKLFLTKEQRDEDCPVCW